MKQIKLGWILQQFGRIDASAYSSCSGRKRPSQKVLKVILLVHMNICLYPAVIVSMLLFLVVLNKVLSQKLFFSKYGNILARTV